jgi:aspartate kinase
MRLVFKFGGTSIADGERMRHVADVIKRFYFQGDEICVVVSALSGITDFLEESARRACKGNLDRCDVVTGIMDELMEKHQKVVEETINDKNKKIKKEVFAEINERLDELGNAFNGIYHLGELTDRSMDYITSFGERLSAPILAGVLRSLGMDSICMSGGESGIVTDENYRNAKPLEDAERLVGTRLIPMLEEKKKKIPVIMGYIGENPKGIITTLGRGGSDYTATLIGSGIGADEIWLWKDTNGIMSADPKMIPHASTIPSLSYIEAMELSYFGAEILHPSALEPAMRNEIPVRIKNILRPEDPGTVIVYETEGIKDVVKAITLIENVALLSVSGSRMSFQPGTAGRIFTALGENNVNIMMISQGSSERTISMIVDRADLMKAIRSLEAFEEIKVSSDKNICAIAVVGAGMAGTPGVVGRLFSALGREGVNVTMISQGSSEYNISLAVRNDDARRAIGAIHDEFMGCENEKGEVLH